MGSAIPGSQTRTLYETLTEPKAKAMAQLRTTTIQLCTAILDSSFAGAFHVEDSPMV